MQGIEKAHKVRSHASMYRSTRLLLHVTTAKSVQEEYEVVMDWIVFGDDWNAHPSTTQHLIRHLPVEDKVIWVNSIGARSPQFNRVDIKRAFDKLSRIITARLGKCGSEAPVRNGGSAAPPTGRRMAVIEASVLPFHLNAAARAFNHHQLSGAIRAAAEQLGIEQATVLVSSPVAVEYLEGLPATSIAYLRLDEYASLPGNDPELIHKTEPRLFERADAIFVTARKLMPPEAFQAKSYYLPQGVDFAHFSTAPVEPKAHKVLGFFGLMERWIDHRLIDALAMRKSDWKFSFIGNRRFVHPSLLDRPNIEFLPAVPYSALPSVVADWSAAWIPFELSPLTDAVNPLKLREYLAMGLPTHCTPLPETRVLQGTEGLLISDDVAEISAWLDEMLVTDTAERRLARRQSVQPDGWTRRSQTMRDFLTEAATRC